MSSVVDHVAKVSRDMLTMVCAGKQGRFALEDAVCAGMLIDLLAKENNFDLSDGAGAARALFKMNEQSIADLLEGVRARQVPQQHRL